MKRFTILPLALLLITVYSCNQNGGSNVKNSADSTFTTSYYVAADGQDTAHLTLKNYKTKVEGDLIINYAKKDKNDGVVKGTFKGDTLFVDYTFKIGDKNPFYKNPLALLKKDGKLFLGIGKMESTFGKTYFRKDIPIDFSAGKFVFEEVQHKK